MPHQPRSSAPPSRTACFPPFQVGDCKVNGGYIPVGGFYLVDGLSEHGRVLQESHRDIVGDHSISALWCRGAWINSPGPPLCMPMGFECICLGLEREDNVAIGCQGGAMEGCRHIDTAIA